MKQKSKERRREEQGWDTLTFLCWKMQLSKEQKKAGFNTEAIEEEHRGHRDDRCIWERWRFGI